MRIAKVAASAMSVDLLLADQIHMLAHEGHSVIAVCAPGPFVPRLRAAGIHVRTVDLARELSPFADVRSLFQLWRLFRQERVDVVHTHTPKAGLLGPLAAQLAGVPHVVHTIHGLLFHDRMNRSRRWLFWLVERFTAAFSDVLLSQSREDVAVAVNTKICAKGEILFIGNGIDVSRFSPQPPAVRTEARNALGFGPDDIIVGTVGRLVSEKGYREFFAMAEAVKATHPRTQFLAIGPAEDDQNDAIPAVDIADLERRGIIRYLPWQDDMPRMYASMDIFVCASHREGIPRACMEAAASGLPVVATDIRGCREVVVDGDTGLLVPIRNVPALSSAVQRLCADAGERSGMGVRGTEHIRTNFDRTAVLLRLRDFYAGLNGTSGSARIND